MTRALDPDDSFNLVDALPVSKICADLILWRSVYS